MTEIDDELNHVNLQIKQLETKKFLSILLQKLSNLSCPSFISEPTSLDNIPRLEDDLLLNVVEKLDFIATLKVEIKTRLENIEKNNQLEHLAKNLLDELDRINWPSTVVSKDSYLDTFQACFKSLLRGVSTVSSLEKDQGRPLFPFSVLCRPLLKRFKFHFFGIQPTNRIDRPEWFFRHVLNLVKLHSYFLTSGIQPLLPRGYFAIDEFLYCFFDILTLKLKSNLQSIENSSSSSSNTNADDQDEKIRDMRKHILTSRLLHEALDFDMKLQSLYSFHYLHHFTVEQATDGFFMHLITTSYLTEFTNTESELARMNMRSIFKDPDAFTCLGKSITKVGFAFTELLESITELYKRTTNLECKRIFIHLQYDMVYEFINLVMSSIVNDSNSVMDSLETNLRHLSTLNYLLIVLKRWSTLPFYIQVADSLGFEGGAFDGPISQLKESLDLIYNKTRKITEKIIDPTIHIYKSRPRYSAFDVDVNSLQDGILEISQELIPCLNKLNSILNLMMEELENIPFEMLYVMIVKHLKQKFKNVIISRMYSPMDAQQLRTDILDGVLLILRRFDLSEPRPQVPLHFKQVLEYVKIVADPWNQTQVMKALDENNHDFFTALDISLTDIDTVRSIYHLRLDQK